MKTMRFLLTAALLVAALPLAAAGQQAIMTTQIPEDDPRARFVGGLARLLVAGDSAGAADYVLRSADPSADRNTLLQRVGVMLAAVRELGPVSVAEFRASEGEVRHLRASMAGVSGNGVSLNIQVTGDPPRIMAMAQPIPYRAPAVEQFASFDALDRALQQRVREDRFSGVVLVGHGDEVLFQRGYGLAERERGTAIRPDTRFNIASVNKFFTGVAILRLAQEGRLDLDAPVGRYLQGLPADVAGRVTIRQLLQHRSGLGDYLRDPEFNQNRDQFRNLEPLLALIRSHPLEFEPGTNQRYSNSGFVVLGGVIEALTGKKYDDVIREWILVPAGMTHTGPGGPGEVPNTAHGYSRAAPGSEGELISVQAMRAPATPAGGGYSTAEDLFHYARALVTNRLLEPEYTSLMLNSYSAGSRPPTFSPSGGVQGANAVLSVNHETGAIAVVLANLDPPAASQLAPGLLPLATAAQRRAPKQP